MALEREIGFMTRQAGVVGWDNLLDEDEQNPELRWPQSVRVYDRMRSEDAQVGSVLRAVTMPIMSTQWAIDPNGADDEVVDLVSQDLGLPIRGRRATALPRLRGRFSWMEHLRHALLSLVFGHAFFEQVYRIDDAGRAHLRKLAYRPPQTISAIEVAADGGLVAISQHGWAASKEVRIPVDRLVAYVSEREGGRWQGRSLLRQAYKDWLLKDRALRVQSMTLERNGLGIPTYTGAPIPDGATPAERDAWVESQIESGLKLATELRAGQSAGASIPHGAKLAMQGVDGDLPNSDAPIRYYDEQIARAVLAHFLNLGTETGSWALGSTFADFFTQTLNAVAQSVADTAQQHVIEDLVDLNWGESVPAPRLMFDRIGSTITADAIKALIDCGAIWPDKTLEEHLRDSFNLPAQDLSSRQQPETEVEP